MFCLWREFFFCFFKQKPAYELRISDWSSDVCSSDLLARVAWGADAGHVVAGAVQDGAAMVAVFPAGAAVAGRDVNIGRDPRDRSEERRVGTEGVSKCSFRWSPEH